MVFFFSPPAQLDHKPAPVAQGVPVRLVTVVVAAPGVTAENAKSALAGPHGPNGPRLIWVDASQQLCLASPRIAADLWFLSSVINDRPEIMPAGYPWAMM